MVNVAIINHFDILKLVPCCVNDYLKSRNVKQDPSHRVTERFAIVWCEIACEFSPQWLTSLVDAQIKLGIDRIHRNAPMAVDVALTLCARTCILRRRVQC